MNCDVKSIAHDGIAANCRTHAASMESDGYRGGRDVTIDCGSRCAELWIDTDEPGVMCVVNERSKQRIAHIRETTIEYMRDLERRLHFQAAIRGAFKSGFMMGAIIF